MEPVENESDDLQRALEQQRDEENAKLEAEAAASKMSDDELAPFEEAAKDMDCEDREQE